MLYDFIKKAKYCMKTGLASKKENQLKMQFLIYTQI